MERLNDFRRLACDRLEVLLNELNTLGDADNWLDGAIRSLSALPSRPSDRKAYEGILGANRELDDWRDRACNRFYALLSQIDDVNEWDLELDSWLRKLSELPERPDGANPYDRLFVLRSEPVPEAIAAYTANVPEIITLDQLFSIIGSRRYQTRVTNLYPGLMQVFAKYDIDKPLRVAHFLAQVLHESGGFKWLREIWGPTAAQLRYEPPSTLARRLGNIKAGDGARFMGRSPIQVTGRYNYLKLSEWSGIDFESKPDDLEKPEFVNLGPAWYWTTRNLNRLADQDSLKGVTKVVNGGYNGLADRARYLARAKSTLKIR